MRIATGEIEEITSAEDKEHTRRGGVKGGKARALILSRQERQEIARKGREILSTLCEGASMRSVSRLAVVSINTVSKLLEDAGRFCASSHDAKVRGVKAKRVQSPR